jgi:hypothetical protein
MWNFFFTPSAQYDRSIRLACAIVIGSLVFYGFR